MLADVNILDYGGFNQSEQNCFSNNGQMVFTATKDYERARSLF